MVSRLGGQVAEIIVDGVGLPLGLVTLMQDLGPCIQTTNQPQRTRRVIH
jgi:hypothetical protein